MSESWSVQVIPRECASDPESDETEPECASTKCASDPESDETDPEMPTLISLHTSLSETHDQSPPDQSPPEMSPEMFPEKSGSEADSEAESSEEELPEKFTPTNFGYHADAESEQPVRRRRRLFGKQLCTSSHVPLAATAIAETPAKGLKRQSECAEKSARKRKAPPKPDAGTNSKVDSKPAAKKKAAPKPEKEERPSPEVNPEVDSKQADKKTKDLERMKLKKKFERSCQQPKGGVPKHEGEPKGKPKKAKDLECMTQKPGPNSAEPAANSAELAEPDKAQPSPETKPSELEAPDKAQPLPETDDEEHGGLIYSSDEGESLSDDDIEAVPVIKHRGSDQRATQYGMEGKQFRALLRLGAPAILFHIIRYLFLAEGLTNNKDLDAVEYFSGVATYYRACRARNFRSAKYDLIEHGIWNNILTSEGFIAAVQLARRLKFHSLSSFATVCSTWIWVCRGSTRRSQEEPLGAEPRSQCVTDANWMVARVTMIWMLIVASGGFFLLEQPGSSLMCLHPRVNAFALALEKCGQSFHHISTWMGMFGGETPKRTRLWSNSHHVTMLKRKLKKDLFTKSTTCTRDPIRAAAGLSSINGNGKTLHETQAYPEGYGHAVADMYEAIQYNVQPDEEPDVSDSSDDANEGPAQHDEWNDANMKAVADLLGNANMNATVVGGVSVPINRMLM